MKDAHSEAAEIGFKAHARRLHVGIRRPHNWLQLARYCVVGASGYVVNLGVYSLLYTSSLQGRVHHRLRGRGQQQLPLEPACGPSASYTACPITSTPASSPSAASRCAWIWPCSTFLVDTVGLHKVTAAAIAIVVATPVSFLGNKLWSFR